MWKLLGRFSDVRGPFGVNLKVLGVFVKANAIRVDGISEGYGKAPASCFPAIY